MAELLVISLSAALIGRCVVKAVQSHRDIKIIDEAKKTGNPLYQKHGLLMNWTDHEHGEVKGDKTYITPK